MARTVKKRAKTKTSKRPTTNTASASGRQSDVRRRRRYRPGKRALKEIRTYQKSTELLIRKMPFLRIVRRLVDEIPSKTVKDMRFQSVAFLALQEALEAYVVGVLEDVNLAAIHRKRVTIHQKDIVLVKKVRPDIDKTEGGGIV